MSIINSDRNVNSYLKCNYNIVTEAKEEEPLISILKTASSISKHGDVVTFREEVRA